MLTLLPSVAQEAEHAKPKNHNDKSLQPEANQAKQLSEFECPDDKQNCKQQVEHIEVVGRKLTPISYSTDGVYTLDKQMLNEYLFGNGNLNEVLGILPGVQFGEAAYAANQVTNIKPSEVSISGAKGYQSGYQIDGVSNNSKLNIGSGNIDRNLAQNVSGHSQEAFVNLKILDQVEVYDSNIPAKYGQFSGGLVLATTQNADNKPRFGFSYRQTASDYVDYHQFYAPDFSGDDVLDRATFEKKDFNAYLSTPINNKSGIVAQIQVLNSKESLNQLGELRLQKQSNYNGLLKYHYNLTENDELQVRYLYAPYTGNYFNVNAINSDFDVKGGGQSFMTKWRALRQWGQVDTQFSWRQSQNSKNTAEAWYVWANLPGKAWGSYDGSNNSLAGGYGDIKKRQDSYSFKQDFESDFRWGGFGEHALALGYQLEYQQSVFDRLEDSIIYNGAVISPSINCNGYKNDCVETQFKRPLAELESELGRPLNLNNPDDFLLYQNNIKTTGQFFQTRQVSPKARATADIAYLSAYVEDSVTFNDLLVTAGLRYDYNDFFRNHNFAPRLRLSYELIDSYQVVLGANRYYQADIANYKLNQAMQPVQNEVRATYQNRPQQWQAALLQTGYKYQYRNTQTPFSDELVAAYRQPLFAGVVELKWVERANKQGINRIKGYNELGEAVLYAGNDGRSDYQRWSLSWMAQFSNQHIEFNISKSSNKTNRKSFDGATTIESNNQVASTLNYSYNDDELVFLRSEYFNNKGKLKTKYNLVTRHDINLERQDANRPIVANLSWAGHFGNWRLSAYARYNGRQDAIYPTSQTESIKEAISICDGCVSTRREYPVYRKAERPSFWLLSGSISYLWQLPNNSQLTLSFDGENLLNKRTYQVSPFTTGLELGRRFWLGISYDY
ncbi:TonB-dependent receptor plug domain-containing protein [Pseudoalteromonas sp. UG3-2]